VIEQQGPCACDNGRDRRQASETIPPPPVTTGCYFGVSGRIGCGCGAPGCGRMVGIGARGVGDVIGFPSGVTGGAGIGALGRVVSGRMPGFCGISG